MTRRRLPGPPGRSPGGPRCLQPMSDYVQARPLDELDPAWRDETDRVCWRPLDHPPGRHTSKASYLRMLARERHSRNVRPW